MSLRSLVILAFYFVRQAVARLVRRRGGISLFQRNYDGDKLFPLTNDERACLTGASRCIACGLCDAELIRQRQAATPASTAMTLRSAPDRAPPYELRPSDLALSFTRSLPDHDALGPWVDALKGSDLAGLEAVCPTRVPFRELVRVLEARLDHERSNADSREATEQPRISAPPPTGSSRARPDGGSRAR